MDTDLRVPLAQRIPPWAWVMFDAALATLLLAVTIAAISTRHEAGAPIGTGWDALRYLAAGLACVALPLRRRWPAAALAATATGDAALIALGTRGPAQLAVAFAIYTAAVRAPGRLSLGAVGLVVAAMLVGALVERGGPEWAAVIAGPAVVLVGWFAGENTRARRAYAQGLAQRAAEREREREGRVRQAAVDERVRIARELHDIVAHAMSLIAVRAGAARMVIENQPEDAREGLFIIETTSRRALSEMRRLVGVLRQSDDNAPADLEPAPGLGDVDQLIRHSSQAGVHVDVQVTGEVRSLPAGVDISAYRIVQEALTNVVRHAGPTNAHLRVRYRPDELEIELIDDGAAKSDHPSVRQVADGPGHGLVGMRERVALYRGELIAEPTRKGYRVLARLPIEDDRR